MEKYTRIFDILYKYKDFMSDDDYLNINNDIKSLYELARKNTQVTQPRRQIGCHCFAESHVCYQGIDALLTCRKFYQFISLNPIIELLYRDAPVELTREPIYDQENFRVNQVMKNLTNLSYLYRSIKNDPNLLTPRRKVIVFAAHTDYIMRNMLLLRENPRCRENLLRKLRDFSDDTEMLVFLAEHEFDINIWKFAVLNS